MKLNWLVFLSCTFLRYDVKPIVCAHVLKFLLLSYLIINLICFGQWVLCWRYWFVSFLCSFASFFFLFTRWGARKYVLLIFTTIVTFLFRSYRVIAHTNVSFRISNSTKHRLAVRRRLMDVFFFDCTIFALKAHGVYVWKVIEHNYRSRNEIEYITMGPVNIAMVYVFPCWNTICTSSFRVVKKIH